MKPIHLNLAARPYRDYRPVYAVVVVMSLVTAYLLLNNIETYYQYIHDTKSTRAEIAKIEGQTEEERRKRAAAQDRLATLDLGRLDKQTKFVNARLAERAFSWSTLLDELESILADDVRLQSIAPRFQDDGTIQLAMNFRSKSSDGMITTINRMNGDPQFRNPFPSQESFNEGTYTFDLVVQYIPESANKSEIVRTSARAKKSGGRR